jgi:hypothetical protein
VWAVRHEVELGRKHATAMPAAAAADGQRFWRLGGRTAVARHRAHARCPPREWLGQGPQEVQAGCALASGWGKGPQEVQARCALASGWGGGGTRFRLIARAGARSRAA